MSDRGELRRLLESDLPNEIRTVLESASADEPSAARITKVEVRLAPMLGWAPPNPGPSGGAGGGGAAGSAGAGGGAASSGAVAAGGGTVLKGAAIAAVIGGVAAVGGWIAVSERATPVDIRTGMEVAPPTRDERTAPSVADEPPEQVVAPELEEEATVPQAPPRSTPPRDELPPEPTPAVTLQEELRLVDGARTALDTDPARALALAREHRARFPDGVLAPERELLAIEALLLLGRTGEATERAADFRRHHHVAAHARRLDRLLTDHALDPSSVDNASDSVPMER